jgi:hypothetical protein
MVICCLPHSENEVQQFVKNVWLYIMVTLHGHFSHTFINDEQVAYIGKRECGTLPDRF